MAGSFEKILTATDVSYKLAVPTKFLRDHGGGDQLMVMDNHTKRMYEFVLSTRAGRYKKPVFINDWLKYSRDKQLRAGQTIFFWKNDDEEFYRIQVLIHHPLGAGAAGLQ
ncbi:hypothetical protein FNV43_RR20835 [Rhamnella rubrinervis]|uniref:TF-B3 domain-containing protein n=1 Tax=Rhamnella rubrinervis TaxID=2594499 RepID=A0A8K0E1X5_9ROSA|nr:hypothetical protein FNV43_RR20835 [Rhamnella rubrinervis]